MIFIHFVENAFKYATNKKIENAISIRLDISENKVSFMCKNHINSTDVTAQENNGLGFKLIKQRLELIYKGDYNLDVHEEDLVVEKRRYSAFIQGASDLDTILKGRGIGTLIITGTLTNVCCESTARDAMMMNYRSVMVSDGNAAVTDFVHEASLVNMISTFGDVYSTDETIELLRNP